VDSLPKTVTRQRRGCDLNPGLSALESSTLTTRLASHPVTGITLHNIGASTPSSISGYATGPPSCDHTTQKNGGVNVEFWRYARGNTIR